MNRSLILPAIGCLVGFAMLLTSLQGAAKRSTNTDRAATRAIAQSKHVASDSSAPDSDLLTVEQAQQELAVRSERYLAPWRAWENSSHHLYSRAAPRPIPTILAKINMSPRAPAPSDHFLLASIEVTKGLQTDVMPCAIDRRTKRMEVFADGQWLTEEEWLQRAPQPNARGGSQVPERTR